ncbi:hypothetical protein [Georgenia sp. Z1491]|uniref:hypothetical protein n=1 Tax=Georgenia sp. Z1491 TaxID=3416707 RepID=UPI003CF17B90
MRVARFRVVLAFSVVVSTMLAACGGSEGAEPPSTSGPATVSEAPPHSEPDTFHGTPSERTAAMATCMEDLGYLITPEDDGFEIEPQGHSGDDVGDDYAACSAQVGRVHATSFSDAQIRESYDRRVDEHDCLVANGWAIGDPPAWETFRDGWRVQGSTWEPVHDAQVAEDSASGMAAIAEECTSDADVW